MSDLDIDQGPEFERLEMEKYGFDPDNSDDVIAFHATDPADPYQPVTDYSKDSFEIGGVHRQIDESIVQSEL